MSKLYDYYDVEYDANGERPYKEDSDYVNEPPVDEPDPVRGCTDSSALNYNSQVMKMMVPVSMKSQSRRQSG